MPDYKKWNQIQSAMESLSKMMADYGKDFSNGGEDTNEYEDKDSGDGGSASIADMEPEIDSGSEAGDEKTAKKRKISAMSKMIKKSMGF